MEPPGSVFTEHIISIIKKGHRYKTCRYLAYETASISKSSYYDYGLIPATAKNRG
jgi:hypothetical protein